MTESGRQIPGGWVGGGVLGLALQEGFWGWGWAGAARVTSDGSAHDGTLASTVSCS